MTSTFLDRGFASRPPSLLLAITVILLGLLIMCNPSVYGADEHVSLDPVQPWYLHGDTVHIQGNLTHNSAPLDNEIVGVQVTGTYGGTLFAGEATTNTTGAYSIQFTIPGWAAYGTCTIHVAYRQARNTTTFLLKETTPPDITDTTPASATTGQSFTFNATITDNVDVEEAFVEYYYDGGSHTNISMNNVAGDHYTASITIADTLETLHYSIAANDTYDNWNTSSGTISITDPYPPVVTDNSPGSAYTGDLYTFNATITDNVDVDTAWVEYWYDSGGHTNISLSNTHGTIYTATVTIPAASDILHYTITANDTSDNWNTTTTNVTIIDNDRPELTPLSPNRPIIPTDTDGNPTFNETATLFVSVNDSSNISSVTINLTSLGRGTKNMAPVDSTGVWYIETNASTGTAIYNTTADAYQPHHLEVNATDTAGNWNTTNLTLTIWKNGDVTGNGAVNFMDASYLAKHLIGQPGYTFIIDGVADVSGNGAINFMDASYLAKHLIGQTGYEVLQ